MLPECTSSTIRIPPRPDNAPTGSEFGKSILNLPLGPEREAAILQELLAGNVPDFMRHSRLLTFEGGGLVMVLEVLPDVLCVGTDEDFLRVPMNPKTAQRVADVYEASLITPTISDVIWKQADVKLEPMAGLTEVPNAAMTSTADFIDQNAKIEAARKGRPGLLVGHKKDVVIANTLALPEFKDNRVAIYGWHHLTGIPIQGLNPSPGLKLTHEITYADYSHGIRLVAKVILINNDQFLLAEALVDPVYSVLLNGGPLQYLRYPTP